VLDVNLIEQERQHGLFSPSIAFKVISQILRSHCARMRDPAVDAMVQLVVTCAPSGGAMLRLQQALIVQLVLRVNWWQVLEDSRSL